ncbi:MAG: carbon-nitrogen hydrolase family protein [Gemmatimonadaceae bacterium]|nr:carbon-nitrogen hydrolase family protein [Gemmatimonadaceae bacterium]
MRIALASPPLPASIDEALEHVRTFISDAASQGARVVCFPEAYVPGLRGQDFPVPAFDSDDEARVVGQVSDWSRAYRITTILGIEHRTPEGRQVAALVVDRDGRVRGMQTKNQLDPSEEAYYVPGTTRQLFESDGLRFGIAICHEGWRYPETVRWAAGRGAQIVFHPQITGSDREGPALTSFGAPGNPYYEQAMRMRSRENTVYFASVNVGLRYQESATALIAPSGECQAHLPYGRPGLLVAELDLAAATGYLARRFAPERLVEAQ